MLQIPFKNLINDSYCRELSNKLRIQYKTQRSNGEFIGNFACFGYMKSPEDKHQLIIDEDAAQVVRLIYAKRIEGYSCRNIADYLNMMGFLLPVIIKSAEDRTIRVDLNRIQSADGETNRSDVF